MVGGNANITNGVYATTGDFTGNVTAGNISTSGELAVASIAATGNITGGNLISNADVTTVTVTASGNVDAGNINSTAAVTGVTITASGNLEGGNAVITGDVSTATVSASGNIVAANINANTNVTATTVTATTVEATGNLVGGNANITNGVYTSTVTATGNVDAANVNATSGVTATTVDATGNISGSNVNATSGIFAATGDFTGNVTAAYFFGNGSQLTGIDATQIQNGNSNIKIGTANGNITVSVTGVSNTVVFTPTSVEVTGEVNATGNILGANVNANGAITAASATVTGNVDSGNINVTSGVYSSTGDFTGNVTAGNLLSNAAVTGVTVTATGNLVGGNANITNGVFAADVTATGNVNGGNINSNSIVGSNIVITGGNVEFALTGNIDMGQRWINDLADPVQAYDAATKQYVDDAVSSGIQIHPPVLVESPDSAGSLNATYAQGGTTHTVTDIIGNTTVQFSSAHGLSVNDLIYWSSSFNGITANVGYLVYSVPASNQITLSATYNGAELANLTAGTGLSQTGRANPGVGATLTNAGTLATLVIDGVTMTNGDRALIYSQTNGYENGVYVVTEAGDGSTAWVLTRASDMNTYIPNSINGVDAGDYFFIQAGDTGAGESYVMTGPTGVIILGYSPLVFTQFSASSTYSAGNGLSLNGTIFSVNVDNDTTAIVADTVVVKAGANLVTPNIGDATGNSLTLSGNGLLSATTVTATGNVNGSNINATNGVYSTTVDVSGNVLAGNLNSNAAITGVTVTATGNLAGGNANITNGVYAATGTYTGNVDAANINATTNVTGTTITASGNLVGGNANITNGVYATTGDFTGNVTAGNISTTGELAVATIAASGNITGGNLISNADVTTVTVTASGNIDGSNVNATNGVTATTVDATTITATGNLVGGNANITNAVNSTTVNATGNITAANLVANSGVTATTVDATTITATGNLVGGNANITNGVYTSTIDASGNVTVANLNANTNVTGTTITATGNLVGGNAVVTGDVSAATGSYSGNVIAGNVNSNAAVTGVTITASGNLEGGNAVVTGDVSAATGSFTGNVTGGNLVTLGNVDGATGYFTGNVTAQNFFGNISGNIDAGGANTEVQFNDGDILAGSPGFTFDKTSNILTVAGNVVGGNLKTLGEIKGSDIISTANISGVDLFVSNNVAALTVSASGNMTANNISVTNELFGEIVFADTSLVTPNLTSLVGLSITSGSNGNIVIDPDGTGVIILEDETANRMLFTGANKEIDTSANATFDGANLVITGSLQVDNVVVNGNDITSTGTELTVNADGADVNFRVAGDNQANLFIVDAGSDTVLIGTDTPTTNASLKVGTTDSILVPVGNTAQRPSAPVAGMVRFNTSLDVLEFYDSNSWTSATSEFTVIEDDAFVGDGSTVAFTLSAPSTTASTLVSINGVLQIPITAYSVSGTTLTFTEAPESTDLIDVRILTTTVSVTSISNGTNTASVEVLSTADVEITGNLVPAANVTYSLGSPTAAWDSLYVAGNTIYLGGLQLKDIGSNTFAIFTSDGITQADLDVGAIDVSQLSSGNSIIGISGPNGNAFVQAGGVANVLVVSPEGIAVTGNADVSGSTIFLGDLQLRAQDVNTFAVYKSDGVTQANIDVGTVDVSSITQGTTVIGIDAVNGNAYITVGGIANIAKFTTDGGNITGNLTVTKDVVAQNLNSLSDATLKTNIQPIANADDVIDALFGVEYDWKDGSGHSYGMLAQVVEKTLPAAVRTDANGIKSVNYQMITPFLLESLKKQRKEVTEQKSVVGTLLDAIKKLGDEIAELKNRIK